MARSHAPLVGPGQPIEVPHALGAAAPFLALAVLSALLLLIPEVPPEVAAFAAAAFSLAAVGRAVQQRRALREMQVSIDRVLLHRKATPLSPLLVWRASQLCAPEAREHLAAALRRAERSASAAHLAGASPLNRPAIRSSTVEIEALAGYLAGAEPVSAKGVLLVHHLLEDPSAPLYGHAPGSDLRDELRAVLAALREPAR